MISTIVNWFKKPFNEDGNAVNWILFFGLFVIATYLWTTVLAQIKE